MEGFLKNKHHNIYLNKEYNYKKYICKDCTKKKKNMNIVIVKNILKI